MEHPRRACSGQPKTPGSKKARYTINCLRPSNRSSRLTLPLGPSNSYFFSTAIHGIRRRSAASASRERVKAFSFARSFCRAASQSCCATTGGVFIATCSFGFFLSLFLLLVAISFLLRFLEQTEANPPKNILNLPMHRRSSSCGCVPGDQCYRAFDACPAHYVP